MSVTTDFSWSRLEDGVLIIEMSPPVPVGGWGVLFSVRKRFDSTSGYVALTKSAASGYGGPASGYYAGVSGVSVTDSGQGKFSISINSQDTSGLDSRVLCYAFERLDSGNRTILSMGNILLLPSIGI